MLSGVRLGHSQAADKAALSLVPPATHTQLPVLALGLLDSRSPALSLPLGKRGESREVCDPSHCGCLSSLRASYTSRVVRGPRHADRGLPEVEHRKPSIPCASPIGCGPARCASSGPLSLPAPRVVTWVALGGLEQLSSSLHGFYFGLLFQAVPVLPRGPELSPRQPASLQAGSLSQDRTNTPPPAALAQGSECRPATDSRHASSVAPHRFSPERAPNRLPVSWARCRRRPPSGAATMG